MHIAGGDSVTDPVQRELRPRLGVGGCAHRVGTGIRLRPSPHPRLEIRRSVVRRLRFELEVDLIVGGRPEIDDHGIGDDLGLPIRIVVAQHRHDLLPLDPRLLRQALAEADLDPEFGERLQIGGGVHRSHVDADRAFGADVGDLLAAPSQTFDGVEGGVEPVVVEDEHPLLRLEPVVHDVPDVEARALLTEGIPGVGDSSGGDDDDVGVERKDVVRLGEGVQAQIDPVLPALLDAPVDDADEIAAALRAGGEANLPAGGVLGLEQGHAVPAHCGDAGGFEPGGTGTDDDDMLGSGLDVVGDLLRQVRLPAAGRVVDAGRRSRGVDGVEAHVRTHAGPDVVLALLLDLRHQIRIGQLCSGHADEVEAAVLDREAGGRSIRDARGVENG